MNIFIAASDPAGISIGIGEIIVGAVITFSVVILAAWVVFYSGPAALAAAPPRGNRVPLFLPFLLLAGWIALGLAASCLVEHLPAGLVATQEEFVSYLAQTFVELVMAIVTVAAAVVFFPRGLKGFGLDVRTIPRDALPAVVNLLAVLPLVWLGVWAVDVIGKWLVGPAFEIRANEGLDVLTRNPEPLMRILMLSFVLIVVPLFEEVLFRGMFQSTIRGYARSAWLAILVTSVLFAAMHPWQHWLAIFMLSAGMGYAYERSGSLFRPIFIHILFNTTNVLAALLSN